MKEEKSGYTEDIFLLLTPSQLSEEFHKHHIFLQESFGGRRIEPVHFTCQHLICRDRCQLGDLVSALQSALAQVEPLPLIASTLVPLYSEFRTARVLKWRIQSSPALLQFANTVTQTLAQLGGRSLYPAGWQSTLITALEGIRGLSIRKELQSIQIPRPLFTGNQVTLARYHTQEDYTALESFPLKGTHS